MESARPRETAVAGPSFNNPHRTDAAFPMAACSVTTSLYFVLQPRSGHSSGQLLPPVSPCLLFPRHVVW